MEMANNFLNSSLDLSKKFDFDMFNMTYGNHTDKNSTMYNLTGEFSKPIRELNLNVTNQT
jgi:hypothetical protein